MNESKQEKIAFLFTFIGYSIFGFSFLFSKQALEFTSPFVLLAVRFTVSFLLLNGLVLTGKFTLQLKGKKIKNLLILGLFQPIFYFIFENFGVKILATSFVGSTLALIPIVSLLLSVWVLGESASRSKLFFAVFSIIGVIITTIQQPMEHFRIDGFLLILGAVFSASMFNVLSRRASRAFGVIERTYVMFGLGAMLFSTIAFIEVQNTGLDLVAIPFAAIEFWISILFLSAVSSVGAFLLINYGVTYLETAKTAIFANVTTVISILAGVFLLKETFGIYQLIGSSIILISVYGVNRPAKKFALQKNTH
ncbi:MAG TPA: EamA family transporter [Eubacteriaceae bacterium]|nr:EamA family transporter [Eubacteriaceae bacterium]